MAKSSWEGRGYHEVKTGIQGGSLAGIEAKAMENVVSWTAPVFWYPLESYLGRHSSGELGPPTPIIK